MCWFMPILGAASGKEGRQADIMAKPKMKTKLDAYVETRPAFVGERR
jgi:hypothetical protein